MELNFCGMGTHNIETVLHALSYNLGVMGAGMTEVKVLESLIERQSFFCYHFVLFSVQGK